MIPEQWIKPEYAAQLAKISAEACGAYFTFEGPDGGGKTTHAQRLAEHLLNQGYCVRQIREPGGTSLGERVRAILLDNSFPIANDIAQFLLFVSQRAELTHTVIIPSLLAGEIVIGDRGADSSVAYQGYASGLDPEMVGMINAVAMSGLEPQLTFMIDREVQSGLEAAVVKKEFKAGDRYEARGVGFQQKVREGFLTIARANQGRCKIIPFVDGGLEEMQGKILQYVDPLLAQRTLKRASQ